MKNKVLTMMTIILMLSFTLSAYGILSDALPFMAEHYVGIVRIFSMFILSVCITYIKIKKSNLVTRILWFELGFVIFIVTFAIEENTLLYLMHLSNINEQYQLYILQFKE